MEFSMAAHAWLRMQSARIRQSTIKGYLQYIKQLQVYFGGMRLYEIHHAHLSEYQVCRTGNTGGEWYKPISAAPTPWTKLSCVSNTNHELNTLQQMLRAAQLWAPLADHYKPLPPTGFKKPKVMSDEERTRFFVLASSRPEWKLALWVATVSHHTGATGVELRSLRIGDVALDCAKPLLYINAETAKCRNRGREIELMPDAVNAFRNCIARAKSLGSFRDDHYIFPFYLQRNVYDVTRPAAQSWITRPWRELREAAGLPWLTPHCLRHQCLTELHENNVPPEVIRKIAGHLSPAMTDHYSHVRRKQQEEALSKISSLSSIMNPAVGSKAAGSKTRTEVGRLARGRRVLRTIRTA